ncbi:MAG: FmdE family protein [Dehalococcoidia bacterium]
MEDAIARACAESAAHHDRLCPRQVLGVRMGLAAAARFGIEVPRRDRRLLVFTESDGCFVDGVTAATGCTLGHRTLRVIDYGRIAITAIDEETREAVRVGVAPGVREAAAAYAPDESRRYYAQVLGYQRMPERELLVIEPVALTLDLDALLGRPGVRVDCARCGEEVHNAREVIVGGRTLCPACAGPAYYRALS